MVTQQVVGPPAKAAIFLTVTIDAGAEEQTAELLAGLSGLARSVAFRARDDALLCTVGIGAGLWDRLYGASTRPLHLHPFEEIRGPRHVAVATGGDLLFHVRARRADLCFELARHITSRLTGIGDVIDEVHGFTYFDERDLLGFVDGTENPEGAAALAAVTIGGEDPAYAGGSYVVVQKYLHDIDAWEALSVAEQERVIGRTKLDDLELPDAVKPSNSHVALNVVTDPDGTEREILRQNMPFGRLADGEFGTYFIGYAADPGVVEEMLRKMFLGEPPGNTDRILDFSTARTGALFFVPSIEFLDDPRPVARPGRTPAPVSPTPPPNSAGDGSLGIGSLKSTPAQRDSS